MLVLVWGEAEEAVVTAIQSSVDGHGQQRGSSSRFEISASSRVESCCASTTNPPSSTTRVDKPLSSQGEEVEPSFPK